MTQNPEPVTPGTESTTPIEPEAYTDEYYRTAVEGYQEFAASGGRQLSARMVRALALADPRPGQRLLDIACGRGEIVLQGALRGAYAVGIDYAQAAMAVSAQSLDRSDELRIGLARMDATRLALQDGTFDVALMLDFVEHVHQPDLEAAMREVARALKPGGRLIIHTSPNRLFEDVVYRYYVRNVHRAVLGVVRLLRLDKGRLFNSLFLPTDPLPPHNEYERQLHINPQSASSLRAALQSSGFRVRRVDYWEPPQASFFPRELRWHNIGLGALDAVRFLRPLSRLPPLNRLFSNHIWVVAERR
ncbi:MAG: class I SAM-dependent methyltransferase [Chloroflexi bacterium]|nr:class I SAM-dependent methyltransferase [Chloroflexota bacterium]